MSFLSSDNSDRMPFMFSDTDSLMWIYPSSSFCITSSIRSKHDLSHLDSPSSASNYTLSESDRLLPDCTLLPSFLLVEGQLTCFRWVISSSLPGDSPPGFMSGWLSQLVTTWQPGTVCHDDIGGIPLPLESASMSSTRDLNILYHSERHLRKFDPWIKTTPMVRWNFTNRLPPFSLTFSVTKFCLNCQKSSFGYDSSWALTQNFILSAVVLNFTLVSVFYLPP